MPHQKPGNRSLTLAFPCEPPAARFEFKARPGGSRLTLAELKKICCRGLQTLGRDGQPGLKIPREAEIRHGALFPGRGGPAARLGAGIRGAPPVY